MFLKSVELFGFKSFADRTKFEFTDGITSLLGPNGSGKSNVVDSIKWVLGTQSLSAVRAGKREDVIFNGTDTRSPMNCCEVILTLNNEDGILNIEATEVEIMRRFTRDGENEYYINKNRALLKNVKELFMDTGVGKTAYSILEQGKIDQILSLKPEDRRYIFEEAAGISRFKQESDECARKLEKTQQNMDQVSILLKDAEHNFNLKRIQLERYRKRKELDEEEKKINVELQLSTLQSYKKFRAMLEEKLNSAEEQSKELDEFLSEKKSGLADFQEEISALMAQRESLNLTLGRIQEQKNSLAREYDLYNTRYSEVKQRSSMAKQRAASVQEKLLRDKSLLDSNIAEESSLRDAIEQGTVKCESLEEEIEKLKSDIIVHEVEADDLKAENDNFSDMRQQISNEISALASQIVSSLSSHLSGSLYSSSERKNSEKIFAAEINKLKSLVNEKIGFLNELLTASFSNEDFKKALDSLDELFNDEINEIKGLFQEYSSLVPTFLDEFTSSDGTLHKKELLDENLAKTYEKEKNNREKIESLEEENKRISSVVALKVAESDSLKNDISGYKARLESLRNLIETLRENLAASELDYSSVSRTIEMEEASVNDVVQAIDNARARERELDNESSSCKDELAAVNDSLEEKNSMVLKENYEYEEKFNRKQALVEEIAKQRANLESLDTSIRNIYMEFFENTGSSLKDYEDHEVTEDVNSLKAKLIDVRQKISSCQNVNYMAEDEFNEAKTKYDFYSKNMEDLEKAKNDIEEVISSIKEKSEAMFLDTYSKISKAFSETFTALFGGGRAELTLSDEENVLESGIEILAQPPGKKLAHLPLLSGGEKSMTAVALLFATYKVKPSPFCILDEIDAALDVRNIGAFLSVLKQFGDKSQFIIITHSKYTVMGSNCLLGVTQQERGVSKMIGYRLDQIKDVSGKEDVLK